MGQEQACPLGLIIFGLKILKGCHHLINEFFGHDVQFSEIFRGKQGKIPLACGAKFSFFVFNLGAYNGVSLVDAFFDKSGHRDCLTNGDRLKIPDIQAAGEDKTPGEVNGGPGHDLIADGGQNPPVDQIAPSPHVGGDGYRGSKGFPVGFKGHVQPVGIVGSAGKTVHINMREFSVFGHINLP